MRVCNQPGGQGQGGVKVRNWGLRTKELICKVSQGEMPAPRSLGLLGSAGAHKCVAEGMTTSGPSTIRDTTYSCLGPAEKASGYTVSPSDRDGSPLQRCWEGSGGGAWGERVAATGRRGLSAYLVQLNTDRQRTSTMPSLLIMKIIFNYCD